MHTIKLEVNGEAAEITVEARQSLLDAAREDLGLTSVHAGCEQGSCGACTVVLDGETVRSCLVFAVQCEGRSLTTVEGLGTPESLHPLMEAFRRHHALQCGYCTPAMVLTALELLSETASPTTAEIREAVAGNLCRCTGYAGIVAAIASMADSVTDGGTDSGTDSGAAIVADS